MTATFGSLGDDDVGTGSSTALGLGYPACHQRHFAAGIMGAVDKVFQILVGAWPSQSDCRRLFPQGGWKAGPVEQEQQKNGGKRFGGAGPDWAGSIVNPRDPELVTALNTKPAGLPGRPNPLPAPGATPEPPECNRIFDSQQVTNA